MKASTPRIAHETPSHRTQNGYTLRQALTQHTTERTCNRTNCPITSLCLHRNTVYQLMYKACRKFYIGSTIQLLYDHLKEHLTNDNLSVKKHLITCHRNTQNIEVKIVTHDDNPTNLRLYEGFYIKKHKLELNSPEECFELRDLLF